MAQNSGDQEVLRVNYPVDDNYLQLQIMQESKLHYIQQGIKQIPHKMIMDTSINLEAYEVSDKLEALNNLIHFTNTEQSGVNAFADPDIFKTVLQEFNYLKGDDQTIEINFNIDYPKIQFTHTDPRSGDQHEIKVNEECGGRVAFQK